MSHVLREKYRETNTSLIVGLFSKNGVDYTWFIQGGRLIAHAIKITDRAPILNVLAETQNIYIVGIVVALS